MSPSQSIRAILLDLDGVLYIGDRLLPGAREAVSALRRKGYTVAGVTNTTTKTRHAIAEKLASLNLPLEQNELFTPAYLALDAIGDRPVKLFIHKGLREDFQAVNEVNEGAEVVLMGDPGGEGFMPETLQEIFSLVQAGAELIALHKNRFWQKPDGLHLDLGAYVAAIEYATGKQAKIMGKPSADFFLGICRNLHVEPGESLMVGDDVESDIGGALQVGMKTALVQTGKYREDFVRRSGIRPHLLIPSIADLPEAISLL